MLYHYVTSTLYTTQKGTLSPPLHPPRSNIPPRSSPLSPTSPFNFGLSRVVLISSLFSCEFRQQLIYKTAEGTVDAQTPVNSVFVHPIIGVEEEGKDLYDCLGELYLGGADIEYEGKKGHMMDLMDKFPPMFYIQMSVSRSYGYVRDVAHTSAPNTITRLVESERPTPIFRLVRLWRWIASWPVPMPRDVKSQLNSQER
jgi:hypothetical protein